MRLDQLHSLLQAEIAEQMINTANKNNAGMARDYAQYRENVGRIAGGGDAIDAINRVFKKFYDDEGE